MGNNNVSEDNGQSNNESALFQNCTLLKHDILKAVGELMKKWASLILTLGINREKSYFHNRSTCWLSQFNRKVSRQVSDYKVSCSFCLNVRLCTPSTHRALHAVRGADQMIGKATAFRDKSFQSTWYRSSRIHTKHRDKYGTTYIQLYPQQRGF